MSDTVSAFTTTGSALPSPGQGARSDAGAGRLLAFVIGIDRYEDPGIATLVNAVNDANAVAHTLRESQKYDVRVLSDAGASKGSLLALFEELRANLTPNDRVVIYFAGHGVAEEARDEGGASSSGDLEGFLLPQDAKKGAPDSYLSMQELLKAIEPLPCRHLLLILDCCFAGTIRWQSTRGAVGLGARRMTVERYERYLKNPAWQVLTSAAYDERAVDSIGHHELGERGVADDSPSSPFAAALCRGLGGKADFPVDGHNGDGVIIAAELHLFLEDTMRRLETQLGRPQQTPQLGSLFARDKGQYVFLVPGRSPRLPSAVALTEANNPYLGLKPFEKGHAHLFCGRRDLIEELTGAVELDTSEVIVVHGGSGVGKSSLVRAGLMAHAEKDTGRWRVLSPIQPGREPGAALQQWKTELGATDAVDLAAAIQARRADEPARRILGVIDQAEGALTLEAASADQKAFWSELAAAQRASGGRLRLVLTMPSQHVKGIDERLGGLSVRPIPVPGMNADELREAILGPAQEYDLSFEPPTLVDRLLDDVRNAPGAAPLLSLVLAELYRSYVREQLNDRCLRESHYEALGGVERLIDARVDELLQSDLDAAQLATLRRVLSRMVSFESGAVVSTRQVPMSELRWPEPDEQRRVDAVVRRLGTARLVVVDVDREGRVFVKPAHHRLVTGESALAMSIHAEQDTITLQQRLGQAARDWDPRDAGERRRGDLLSVRDPRLPVLLSLLDREPLRFNEVERRFLLATRERRRLVLVAIIGSVTLVIVGLIIGIVRVRRDASVIEARNVKITKLANDARAKLLSSYVDRGQLLLEAGDPLRALPWLNRAYQGDSPDPRLGFLLARASAAADGLSAPLRLQGDAGSMMTRQANTRVRFSPDGRQIATILDDYKLTLWDVATGQEQRSLSPSAMVQQAAFDPRGDRLLVVTDGPVPVLIWTPSSNEQLALSGHRSVRQHLTVNSAVFSPDGERIATAGEDRTARIWDARTGREIMTLEPHGGPVTVVAFGPRGRSLVTGSDDGHARLWDLTAAPGQRLKQELPDHGGRVNTAELSVDGQHLVTGSESGKVFVWSAAGALEAELHTYTIDLRFASFSPDGERVLTVNRSNTAKVWDAATGAHLLSFEGHAEQLFAGAFNPDGTLVATAGADATTRIWDARRGRLEFLVPAGAWVDAVAFSADGTMAATAGLDGTARTFSVADRALRDVVHAHLGSVSVLAVSAGGRRLVSGSADGTVKVWDGETRALLRSFPGETSIAAVGFDSGDDARLLTATDRGDVFERNVQTGSKRLLVAKETNMRKEVAFSADGRLVAIARGESFGMGGSEPDGVVVRATANDANVKCRIPLVGGGRDSRAGLLSVAFTADGKQILTTGVATKEPAAAALWDAETCQFVAAVRGPARGAPILRLSPDKLVLLTSDSADRAHEPDHTVRFWDPKTGALLAAPGRHPERVYAAAFDESGARAATGGGDDDVVLWDVGSWSRLATFPSSAAVTTLAFMSGGQKLVVGTDEGFLRVLDLSPEPRSKPEMDALVRCRVPYGFPADAADDPHDILVVAEPDPSLCAKAAIRRPTVARSVLATSLLQRADRALKSGDLGAAEPPYREAQEISHALGHPLAETEAALGLAILAEQSGAADRDRRFHDALELLDATTPSGEARARRLFELADALFNGPHLLAATTRLLDAMDQRLPAEAQVDWREDAELLRLAQQLGAGRFAEGLSFAEGTPPLGSSIGRPMAFATLAWIAALQTGNHAATSKWAEKIQHEYRAAWEARIPRGLPHALSHLARPLARAALITQVLELVARPLTDANAAELKRLLTGAT